MSITDYIPHGLVVAFGGVVTYVFRDHVKQDDMRFQDIKEDLETIKARQQQHNDQMNAQHSEVLKILLTAANDRANFQSLLERHDEPRT